MNIILINHYAGSTQHGMEYRPYFLAKYWVRQGHDVTVIASSFSHLRKKQPKVPWYSIKRQQHIDGIEYVWLRGNPYKGNGILRFFNIALFVSLLFLLINRIVEKKVDVVITSSTYPLDIHPAKWLLRKYPRAKLVFEPHDLWPMVLYEIGGMSRSHPFVRMMQRAEDLSCRTADYIVSMHPQNIDHLETRGADRSRFFHIPNGIDLEGWQQASALPEEHGSLLAGMQGENDIVVLYAGSVSIANGLDTLLDAAEVLAERPNIKILIVGNGPSKAELYDSSQRRGLKNISFLPQIDKSAVPRLLDNASICFVGFVHNPLYKYGISPNKLWDYMMAAKPIVMSINCSNDPVAEAECGITVSSGKATDLAAAILELAQLSNAEREEMGLRGRTYVKNNNDYEVLSRRFLEIVQQDA